MTKVSFEYAATTTDFKHLFNEDKVVPANKLPNAFSSPYQTVIESSNEIDQHASSYQFLNGKDQGSYQAE